MGNCQPNPMIRHPFFNAEDANVRELLMGVNQGPSFAVIGEQDTCK